MCSGFCLHQTGALSLGVIKCRATLNNMASQTQKLLTFERYSVRSTSSPHRHRNSFKISLKILNAFQPWVAAATDTATATVNWRNVPGASLCWHSFIMLSSSSVRMLNAIQFTHLNDMLVMHFYAWWVISPMKWWRIWIISQFFKWFALAFFLLFLLNSRFHHRPFAALNTIRSRGHLNLNVSSNAVRCIQSRFAVRQSWHSSNHFITAPNRILPPPKNAPHAHTIFPVSFTQQCRGRYYSMKLIKLLSRFSKRFRKCFKKHIKQPWKCRLPQKYSSENPIKHSYMPI